MQFNDEYNLKTVLQLTKVFPAYSQELISELFEEADFHVDNCVARLISWDSNSTTTTTTSLVAAAATMVPTTNNQQKNNLTTPKTTTTDMSKNVNFPLHTQKYHIPQQTGAIPKTKKNPNNNNNNTNNKNLDNSSGKSNMSANAQTRNNAKKSSNTPTTTTSSASSLAAALSPLQIRSCNDLNYFHNNTNRATNNDFSRTCQQVKLGHRVLVIMRGAAGSGKSTLAKKLINECLDLDSLEHYAMEDFICSTDDFFYLPTGEYKFVPQNIPDAHLWNQNRALLGFRTSLSPIVIDNTNMQKWEMLPYVKMGVQHGYIIEILEPNTNWCKSAGKLALKNTHQVSRDSIQRALNRYEKTTVYELIKMLKDTKYVMSLPQMRLQPPMEGKEQKKQKEQQQKLKQQKPKPEQQEAQQHKLGQQKQPRPEQKQQRPEQQEREQQQQEQKQKQQQVSSEIVEIKKEIHENKIHENLSTPIELQQLVQVIKDEQPFWGEYEDPNAPKLPCNNQPPFELMKEEDIDKQENSGGGSSRSSSSVSIDIEKFQQGWQPYEQESITYWGSQGNTIRTNSPSSQKDLVDLLRDSVNEEQQRTPMVANEEIKEKEVTFNRHCIDCPNEATGFVALRQMYPKKHITGLWDLYMKCKGDVDWAVDILLREDELSINGNDYDMVHQDDLDNFICNCLNENGIEENATALLSTNMETFNGRAQTNTNTNAARSQRQKNLRRTKPDLRDIQLQIENCVVLGDKQYSDHTRKIRDVRNGNHHQGFPLPNPNWIKSQQQQQQQQQQQRQQSFDETSTFKCDDVNINGDCGNEFNTDAAATAVDGDGQQLLEFDLGVGLVSQLCNTFKQESTLGELLPENYATNVFMPRALAKQLYLLLMETVYNQMEEQRQKTLREDEQFARLLKDPKYENCKQSPSNINELLEMERTWNEYANNNNKKIFEKPPPNDIATHLTKMKLCEKFPDIPRDTLMQVYKDQDHSYIRTIEVLGGEPAPDMNKALTQEDFIKRAKRENEMLNHEAEIAAEYKRQQYRNVDDMKQTPMQREKDKRLALIEFENTRNLAAHHSQLRAECYIKAQDAIQRGNSTGALYYSEIASLHRRQIDMCNHRAANYIMQVHELTQNNPELLDLHYLHVVEAIGCLDIFIDQHITALRSANRVYKNVFVITGRGLHSANGISSIKNRVKIRLKTRNLKWIDVNPGLLKVKVFSASKHSTNI